MIFLSTYCYNIRSDFVVSLSVCLSFQASKCWNRFFELIRTDWLTDWTSQLCLQLVNFSSSGVLRTSESARYTVICLLLLHKRRKVPATVCLSLVQQTTVGSISFSGTETSENAGHRMSATAFSQHHRALISSLLSYYFGVRSRVAAEPVEVFLVLEGNLMNGRTPGADKDYVTKNTTPDWLTGDYG